PGETGRPDLGRRQCRHLDGFDLRPVARQPRAVVLARPPCRPRHLDRERAGMEGAGRMAGGMHATLVSRRLAGADQMRFQVKHLENLDELLLSQAKRVVPMRDIYKGDTDPLAIGLRHDVDDNIGSFNTAIQMARWEWEHGYSSTY